MAQPQHFSPDDFTPTKFSTAEQKAVFANQLLAFIAAGFPEKKFTKALYERLCNCFGFIAHLNRNGFFETFFTRTADKLRFIKALANAPCYGDPAYTFSDVERAIGEVVRSMGWVSVYQTKLAQENETIERTLLASLQAKYEGSATTALPPAPSKPFSSAALQYQHLCSGNKPRSSFLYSDSSIPEYQKVRQEKGNFAPEVDIQSHKRSGVFPEDLDVVRCEESARIRCERGCCWGR